jgi:hypothetical protein
MIGDRFAKIVVDSLAGLHLVQVIQRQIVEPALLETAEKVFRRLDGESGRMNAED